uniref:EPS8 signaling adaptor L3b n=1 Tax=Fundulus heteroclitus TaxID=8078 RepID=A0A3Q2NYY9_FUNHE
MFGNNRPFSYSPGGFSSEDFPQRRAFNQDEPRESLLQRNSMSRPSSRSIYKQRKEYAESLNKNPDSFQVRVEHLFICEVDGQEVRTEEDCVAKLKQLDGKSRLWPQEMILMIKGAYLLLCDIETKAELDTIPLMSIMHTSAVLDNSVYDSLLIVTVKEPSKRNPQNFMFQCEETGADIIKADLDKALQRGATDPDPRRMAPDMRWQNPGSFRQSGPRPVQQEDILPTPDYMAPQWNNRQPDHMPDTRSYSPQEEMSHYSDIHESDVAFHPAEVERNLDIFNHVLTDIEIFTDKVANVVLAPPEKPEKDKKKRMSKKKKSKSNAPPANLPHWEEYAAYLQKIKYGFNLLGQLEGALTDPSAVQYVHIFFSSMSNIVPLYPQDLPQTIISPLLTLEAVQLLHQVVSPEEKNLWLMLGDCWAIPRSAWPEDHIEPYIPVFYDGWQPPAPVHLPPVPNRGRSPLSRSNSQRFPPGGPEGQMNDQNFSPRAVLRGPEEPVSNGPMSSLPGPYPTEPPLYMRIMYNFSARNNQELTVMQGEVVQVVQKSRQWWLVRNSRNEEGRIPQNILEPIESDRSPDEQQWDSRGPVTLDYNSSPAQVRAWLQQRNFSRITVSSLGVLTGRQLLEMSKEDIRTVCPEEAGKVFFHLQSVKSSVALSSEPSLMYNSRY